MTLIQKAPKTQALTTTTGAKPSHTVRQNSWRTSFFSFFHLDCSGLGSPWQWCSPRQISRWLQVHCCSLPTSVGQPVCGPAFALIQTAECQQQDKITAESFTWSFTGSLLKKLLCSLSPQNVRYTITVFFNEKAVALFTLSFIAQIYSLMHTTVLKRKGGWC